MRRFLTLFVCCLVPVATSWAASWTYVPSVTLQQTYSDNIQLTVDSLAEDEWVTTIAPGINLTGVGDRWNTYLDYVIQGLVYWRDDNRNQVYNQLVGGTSAELAPERFFMDVNAAYFQQVIDPQQPFGDGNLNVISNRTNSFVADVKPTWIQPIGASTQMDVSYRYGLVDYDSDTNTTTQLDNSKSGFLMFDVGSADSQQPFGWNLSYDSERIQYETRRDDLEFQEAGIELDYDVSTSTQLFADYGAETDFQQDPNGGNLDAPFWRVGVRYNPTASNSFEVSTGERFFGTTYTLVWNYTGQRLTMNVTYREGPTTVTQRQFERDEVEDINDLPPDGELPDLGTTDLFIDERGSLSLVYALSRSSFNLNYYNDRREFPDDGTRSQTERYGAGWSWLFSPRTTLSLSGGHQEFTARSTMPSSPRSRNDYGLTLSNQLSSRASLALILQYLDQQLPAPSTEEINQTMVSLRYTRTF